MPRVFEGQPVAPDQRIGVVVSRYNESVTGKLLSGALETLAASGVASDTIDVVWVPGAWELPAAASALANYGTYAAIICLGAVIRGETTHDQHINRAVSTQLASISVRRRVPVAFGLLTCDSLEQAINRAGGTMGNKGGECAEAALRMANLLREIAESGGPF